MSEALLLAAALTVAAEPGAPPALTLREAIARVAASTPEVLAAAAAQAEAEAAWRSSGGLLRTGLSLRSDPAYVAGVPAPTGSLPSIVGVELRHRLYDPDRELRTEDAKARLADAQGEAQLARSRAAEAVVALFGRCRARDAALRAAEARVSARRTAHETALRLRQEGRTTALDEQRSRLQLAQAQVDLQRARSERDLDDLALRRLVGWPADAPLALSDDAALPEPAIGDDAAVARAADPRLRSLAGQIDAVERTRRIQDRVLAPQVDAYAQYSRLYKSADWDQFYPSFDPDSWSVGASLRLPLFASGRSAAKAESEARLARLRAERAGRERDLELELARAQQALLQVGDAMEVARLSVAVAEEDLRVTRALLAEGRIEPGEVAEKEERLAEAERDRLRADAERLAAEARRLSLRGELVPSGP
jgi:outer membrane protein TolC